MNIGKEIAILHGMTIRELREKHLEVFGDPTRAGHKQYLIRRIAWRMQSLAGIFELYIEKGTVSVTFHPSGIKTLAQELEDNR